MGSVFPIWYTATSRFAPVGGYYGPGGFAELTGMSAIAKLPRKAQDEAHLAPGGHHRGHQDYADGQTQGSVFLSGSAKREGPEI